jgi:hypothetical protein
VIDEKAADRRPREGRAGRHDRLPEELERRLMRSLGHGPGRPCSDGQHNDKARDQGKKPFGHEKTPHVS